MVTQQILNLLFKVRILVRQPSSNELSTRTASQVIAEIERLPPQERELVFLRVHEIEEATIPDSFLQGMDEATRGDLLDIEDAHFQLPPV